MEFCNFDFVLFSFIKTDHLKQLLTNKIQSIHLFDKVAATDTGPMECITPAKYLILGQDVF